MILPSATRIGAGGSAVGAGPATPAPLVILNLEPWQGQSMVPSATWLQRQPTWVQIALKALKTPLAGWLTTTLASVKITPPPSGMSAVWPSTVAPEPAAGAAVPGAAVAAGAVAAGVVAAGVTARSAPRGAPFSSGAGGAAGG